MLKGVTIASRDYSGQPVSISDAMNLAALVSDVRVSRSLDRTRTKTARQSGAPSFDAFRPT
jgi:hypothetical protein